MTTKKKPEADTGLKTMQTQQIPLSKIHADPNQPRKTFEVPALQELKESIMQHGLLQPIAVRSMNGSGYMIIYGERRD